MRQTRQLRESADIATYLDAYGHPLHLQGCINGKTLEDARLVHAHLIKTGFDSDMYLGNQLLDMYGKRGNVVDARQVFDEMSECNLVAWNTMIAGYVRHGDGEEALKLFVQMHGADIRPSCFTASSVVKACADLAALNRGKEVHAFVIKAGFQGDIFVGGAVVDMYSKCGNAMDARKVFDNMSERNVISWNAMIAGYSKNGKLEDALQLFDKMPERNVVSWTAMITAYAQHGRLEDAVHTFDKMPERTTVSWNAMISGYIQNGKIESARLLFDKMPNRNVESWNAMITGYVHSGRIMDAGQLFEEMPERNTVSWSAMIAGYSQNGYNEDALRLFSQMQQAGVKLNQSTFISVISACASLEALEWGRQIHAHIIKEGFELNVFVVGALLNMYAKCSSMISACQLFAKVPERNMVLWTAMITGYAHNRRITDAHQLFVKMPERDVVSWTVIITGYAHNGHDDKALKLFSQMQQANIKPNQSTLTSVISACANQASLEHGLQVHTCIIKTAFESNVFVQSALIAMYAKCGSLDESCQAFDKMHKQDVVSFNAMIAGYAQHGLGKEALQLFEQMQRAGLKPNHVTFIGILSACSHGGLVDEGWHYFHSMSQDHCITPRMDHYGCMVDLLGRAGCLDEADEFISNMPFEPDVAVWGALLGACRIHVNMELGQRAAEQLFKLEPQNAAAYVVLSNLYAAAGRWDDAEKLRIARKARMVKKNPGCSWIVVSKVVHTFLIGDRSHPQTEKIYAMLERLARQMEEAGYVVPNMNLVLDDVEEELKENIIPYHSEKLAIAYGLISTPPGTPIRIIKNLRVCSDCHNATKFISMIVGREIIVRDSSRFHHFKDGLCSCDDYW